MKSIPRNANPTPESPARSAPPGWVDSSNFAEQNGIKAGSTATPQLERLESSLDGDPGTVNWRFTGRSGRLADGTVQRWLSLTADLDAQMTCSRCDEPAPVAVSLAREFLLVADERRAELLDDEAEDYDVLVDDRRFSLTDLLEDECLMALPSFVSHPDCRPVQAEAEPEPARNPFAALAQWRNPEK